MCESMTLIKHLEVIKDDMNFTCKNISKYMSKKVEQIILKPHYIDFEELSKFIYQCQDSLV